MPIFDKDKSRIKLWVGTGGNKGNVHYSVLTHDKKPEDVIIKKMTERILNKHYKNNFTIAVFYDNRSGNEIKRISSGTTKVNNSINKKTAKIKLWIGLPDQLRNATWYNLNSLNNLEHTEIIKQMTERILRDKYKYAFTKAIFYNNLSGLPLAKVHGELIQK